MNPRDGNPPLELATPSIERHEPAPARVIDRFDPEALERGETHRLLLKIIEDGLGLDIHLPLLVARGKKPGPLLMLTAALHGDEINGIPVIHHVMKRIDAKKLRGTVVAVLVSNVPSFQRHQRRYIDGEDLNRLMPGHPSGNASHQYAHRLFNGVVRHADFLIDLHTASRGRVNSLYCRADMTDPKSARLAYLLRPQIIAHKPVFDRTMRGQAVGDDIPSVTLEIGNPSRFQPEFIKTSYTGIRAVMSELGMVKNRPVVEGPPPILCQRTYWIYSQGGGLITVPAALCAQLEAGEPLATLHNVFGQVVHDYKMPEGGVIVGKTVDPVGFSGARIAHIGIVVAAGTAPFVSRDDVRLDPGLEGNG